jgi:hypothetical protein
MAPFTLIQKLHGCCGGQRKPDHFLPFPDKVNSLCSVPSRERRNKYQRSQLLLRKLRSMMDVGRLVKVLRNWTSE